MPDAKSERLAAAVRVGLLAARVARSHARAVGHAVFYVLRATAEPVTAAVLGMTVRARLHGTFVRVLGIVQLGEEEQHSNQHRAHGGLDPFFSVHQDSAFCITLGERVRIFASLQSKTLPKANGRQTANEGASRARGRSCGVT